jgi:LPXTG-motif cell wall-anchored protein
LAKRIARAPTPLPATGLGSGDVAGGGLLLLALACIVARRRILPA